MPLRISRNLITVGRVEVVRLIVPQLRKHVIEDQLIIRGSAPLIDHGYFIFIIFSLRHRNGTRGNVAVQLCRCGLILNNGRGGFKDNGAGQPGDHHVLYIAVTVDIAGVKLISEIVQRSLIFQIRIKVPFLKPKGLALQHICRNSVSVAFLNRDHKLYHQCLPRQ